LFFIVWYPGIDEIPESLRVICMVEMSELVDDDSIYRLSRECDETI
jgi:hypothetical protein